LTHAWADRLVTYALRALAFMVGAIAFVVLGFAFYFFVVELPRCALWGTGSACGPLTIRVV
jgi:hypothetical protein